MKSGSNFPSFFVSLPMLILASALFPTLSGSTPDPVLDTTGNALRTGFEYHILPVLRGRVGGVTLKPTRNNSCPLDVVQDRSQFSDGLPFKFTPVNPKKSIIRTSTDLNIEFSGATICIQSTVWKLADFDELTSQWFITTRGVKGNPGPGTLRNWFKIEKLESEYKLVFCPTVCDFCRPLCMDIGIYFEDGVRRLALSDEPMWVMFKRVEIGSTVENQ